MGSAGSDLDISVAYRLFASGLVVGLGCLSSGVGMARYLDMYIMGHAKTSRPMTSMTEGDENSEASSLLHGNSVFVPRTTMPVTWDAIFTMVFLEAIGLYSLIVALCLAG